MNESLEYVVAARPAAAYEALTAVIRDTQFAVAHADARHLTVAFRPGSGEWGDDPTVLVALLDVGHGLCKVVLAGRNSRDGSVVGLTDAAQSLFAGVEQRLRARAPAVGGGR